MGSSLLDTFHANFPGLRVEFFMTEDFVDLGKGDDFSGDQIYFQGHASPGIYSRAFMEGRLSETKLKNFRRELAPGGGLSSYPHPWLMPEFWEFPTVSMGLGPIHSIYQARFNKYLQDRGLKDTSGSHVSIGFRDGLWVDYDGTI